MFSPPKSVPPLSAEFQSTLEPAHPGAQPQHQGWKLFRSSDGKTNVDQGNHSMITDPAAGQAIRLDHVNKEAQVFPLPAQPSAPAAPSGGSQAPKPPNAPLNVKDLGKRMMGGHEVEGKSYTFQQQAPPQMPGAPKLPGTPQAPAAPQTAGAPQAPGAPKLQPPHVMEVWTSPKLQLPMASRLTGDMGKQTTICKQVTPGEPPPSKFQIPPGYKVVPTPAPSYAPPTTT